MKMNGLVFGGILYLSAGLAQATIIANGNFNGLTSWQCYGSGGSNGGVTRTYDGSGSGYVFNDSNSSYVAQTLAVGAWTNYHVSIWVTGQTISTQGQVQIKAGENALFTQPFSTQVKDYIWRELAFDFNSGANTGLTLKFIPGSSDGAYFRFDDIVINAVPEPTILGLLVLGGLLLRRKNRAA